MGDVIWSAARFAGTISLSRFSVLPLAIEGTLRANTQKKGRVVSGET